MRGVLKGRSDSSEDELCQMPLHINASPFVKSTVFVVCQASHLILTTTF